MQGQGWQVKTRLLPSGPSYHRCQHPCSHSHSLRCRSSLPVPRCLCPCHSHQSAPCGCQCTCWCLSAGSPHQRSLLSASQRITGLIPLSPPLHDHTPSLKMAFDAAGARSACCIPGIVLLSQGPDVATWHEGRGVWHMEVSGLCGDVSASRGVILTRLQPKIFNPRANIQVPSSG